MIKELTLCSLATNSSSPSPTSCMVKVDDGFMKAYGGMFCVSVPIKHEIGCAFNPVALKPFFRKERGKVAYTLKDMRLTVSEKKEKLTVKCLPADDLIIIDNIESPIECKLNLPLLKIAAEITNTEGPTFAHGVTFRDGMMISTNNKVFFCGQSGLPDDIQMSIPKDACLALGKFKSTVVSISKNNHTAKFIFKDGSSLCTHLMAVEFPSIDFLFEGDWTEFKVKEDISNLDYDHIEIRQNNIYYHTKDTIGQLEDSVEGDVNFMAVKRSFDLLLSIDGQLSYTPGRLQSIGEDCVVVSTVYKHE